MTDDAKHRITLSSIPHGIINDIMLRSLLIRLRIPHIAESLLRIAEVNMWKTLVEENFGRVQSEFESKLFIVTTRIILVSLTKIYKYK